jgi:hypothetical protein
MQIIPPAEGLLAELWERFGNCSYVVEPPSPAMVDPIWDRAAIEDGSPRTTSNAQGATCFGEGHGGAAGTGIGAAGDQPPVPVSPEVGAG